MAPATKERVDVILGWLANQGPQTILLFLILCGGGYITTKMVPVHLAQIQEGYERIEARQSDQLKAMADQHVSMETLLTRSQLDISICSLYRKLRGYRRSGERVWQRLTVEEYQALARALKLKSGAA